MATRFEIALHGGNRTTLRAAAEEALDEIDRLESQLSIYRPSSDLARINARAASEPVRVEPRLMRFLIRARELAEATGGAFDITAAPLIRAWGFMGGSGSSPADADLAAAREATGWRHVELDVDRCLVRLLHPTARLDPGAIGKGYALDRATEILREAGVENALFHGGTSTVCAIGSPPGQPFWSVALPTPPDSTAAPQPRIVHLRDESLSVSAVWGKSFVSAGRTLGHVIDPRKGVPVEGARMAAVVLPGATESDAVSTALLVLGPAGAAKLEEAFPGIRLFID